MSTMTRKSIEITATFNGATRINNSVNGNPTFILHTSEGDFRTSSDAGFAYAITNHTGRPEFSANSWIGKRVTLSATRAGRVYDWTLATD